MCGIVQGRGWQIISVALEARTFGEYCETWDLIINKVQKVRILLIVYEMFNTVEINLKDIVVS